MLRSAPGRLLGLRRRAGHRGRDERKDDVLEYLPNEGLVDRLAHHKAKHVQAEDDVGHERQVAARRDLAAGDGLIEHRRDDLSDLKAWSIDLPITRRSMFRLRMTSGTSVRSRPGGISPRATA